MGNQLNLSSDKKKNIIKNITKHNKNPSFLNKKNQNSFLEINTKETSSYRGIKTIDNEDSSEKNTIEDISNKEKRTEKTTNCTSVTYNLFLDETITKIPTNFQWTEPAGVVYLTGSFSNWTQRFMMTKKTNNWFELNLQLPRKRWEYKFIVDNKWCYCKNQPICKDDKGNINNFIDTTNNDLSKYTIQKAFDSNLTPEEKDKNLKEGLCNNSAKKKLLYEGNEINSFCNKFPIREEFNVEPRRIPDNYKNSFKFKNLEDLNEKVFNELAYYHKNYFIKKRDIEYFGENISFASLPVPLHINLNHLCSKPSENGYNEGKRIMIYSTCQRVKQKFITVIYYNPCTQ